MKKIKYDFFPHPVKMDKVGMLKATADRLKAIKNTKRNVNIYRK